MKRNARRAVCIAACACMLFTAVPTVLPMESISITVSAAYDVGDYLDKDDSWYSSSEAIAVADEIVQYQLLDGGWRKDMTNTSVTGSWAKSTIDNGATWGQIRVLARVYNATGTEKYKDACLKGFDLLIKMQYDNGGWPQVYKDDGTYHAHITYNDTAMVSVLRIMMEAASMSGDFTFLDSTRQAQAQNALDKGVECILNTQIESNGTLTAWCQQHDETTLEPTTGRAYELACLSSSESVEIVDFLRSLPDPDARVIRSINAAVRWFDSVKIENIKFDWNADRTDKVVTTVNGSTLWTRFYEIGTNRPMFSDRDGQVYYDVSEISLERRTGYAWYGNWPANNVALGTLPEPDTSISGNLIQTLTPDSNALPSLWSIDTDLQIGDPIYMDRDVTYTSIPDALIGAEAILTPCDAKKIDADLAQLTAKEDLTLVIVYDSRVTTAASWLSDWNTTGAEIVNDQGVVYDLYSKEVKAGETVTLATNGQTSGCTGYAVIAAPAGTDLSVSSEPGIPGDVTCDQTVNAFDLALLKRHLLKGDVLSGIGYECADVNGDGEVTVVDAVKFQRWLLGGDVVLMAYASAVEQPAEPETTEPEVTNLFESADFEFSGDIFIVGDSTVCNYDEETMQNQNRCGWGMKLGDYYSNVNVTNLARSGRSSRSFLAEANYTTLCNSIGEGDYLFIQFGHNDEKTSDADRGTYLKLDFSTLDAEGKNSNGQYSFEWIILNKYVRLAQSKGATAVVVTPVTRRSSDGTANYESHIEYAEGLVAMGQEYNVPVIDMTTLTVELYTELYNNGGADATAEMHCYSDDTQTSIDNTHLSIKGAETIAAMIVDETERLELKISERLK